MLARKKRKSSSGSGSESDASDSFTGQFFAAETIPICLFYQDFIDVSAVKRLLVEDIDLEISLRQRLASTIESRIAWALLLQESLTKNVPGKVVFFIYFLTTKNFSREHS